MTKVLTSVEQKVNDIVESLTTLQDDLILNLHSSVRNEIMYMIYNPSDRGRSIMPVIREDESIRMYLDSNEKEVVISVADELFTSDDPEVVELVNKSTKVAEYVASVLEFELQVYVRFK